jgi:acyl-coenzyme A thioesterase PaaI-like protein
MDDVSKAFIIATVEKKIPIHIFLGVKVDVLEKSFVRVTVPFRDEVVGDVRSNRWHGGMIATIMDSVGAIAGITHLPRLKINWPPLIFGPIF